MTKTIVRQAHTFSFPFNERSSVQSSRFDFDHESWCEKIVPFFSIFWHKILTRTRMSLWRYSGVTAMYVRHQITHFLIMLRVYHKYTYSHRQAWSLSYIFRLMRSGCRCASVSVKGSKFELSGKCTSWFGRTKHYSYIPRHTSYYMVLVNLVKEDASCTVWGEWSFLFEILQRNSLQIHAACILKKCLQICQAFKATRPIHLSFLEKSKYFPTN